MKNTVAKTNNQQQGKQDRFNLRKPIKVEKLSRKAAGKTDRKFMIWTTKVATTETEGRWISEEMGGYLKK